MTTTNVGETNGGVEMDWHKYLRTRRPDGAQARPELDAAVRRLRARLKVRQAQESRARSTR